MGYMCIYKLCTVNFKWFGLQTIMEKLLLREQEKMITAFHRFVLCEIDDWKGMTSEDIENYEIEIQKKCQSYLSSACKKSDDPPLVEVINKNTTGDQQNYTW